MHSNFVINFNFLQQIPIYIYTKNNFDIKNNMENKKKMIKKN